MLPPAYIFPQLILLSVFPVLVELLLLLLLLMLGTAFFIITPFPVVHKWLGLFPAASEVLLTLIPFTPGALVPALWPFMPLVISFFLVMHLFSF